MTHSRTSCSKTKASRSQPKLHQPANRTHQQHRHHARLEKPQRHKRPNRLAAFIKLFGPIKPMGVQSIQLLGTDTLVYENGTLKGTIPGRDFQQAFLSLWFGSNPVTPTLKSALLGN